MKKLINKLLKSEYLSNISIQVIGTGLAQLIPLIIMPFLSRIFAEEDFAQYTSFMALASVLAVATGARYQYAIVLPKKDEDAKSVFLISIYYTILYSLLLLLIAFLFYFFSQDLFRLKKTIFLIPLYILFQGFWLSFVNLSIRNKKFKINAIAKITQTSSNAFSSTSLGVLNISSGLIIGKVFGLFFSVFFLFKKSGINTYVLTKKRIKEISIKYIDFPKYNILPSFLNAASTHAPVFFIGKYYSEQSLGYYGLAFLAIAGPLSIISVSIKDVFYQKITETFNSDNFNKVYKLYINNAFFLLIIGVPITIILYFFGEALFSLVFGNKWEESGVYTSILVFSFVIKLIVSPLSIIFNVINKLKILSRWQITYLITTFLTLGVSILYFKVDIISFLKIYVVHEVILYFYYFILQYNLVKQLKS